jgi:hypothetical protein
VIVIEASDLATVVGGEATTDNLGRCGPGDDLQFLGDVRTPECLAHDLAVRDGDPNGTPTVWSHIKALPLLPAAVGSYFRGLIFGS